MTRRRLLLVGEDFGNSDPRYHSDTYALTGKSGRRLSSLLGFEGDMLRYALATERTNVVTLAPQWRDHALVAQGVVDISTRMERRRTILLGARVAHAFGKDDLELMAWDFDAEIDGWVARLPHPSGRSHWWNDPRNVAQAEEFMRWSWQQTRQGSTLTRFGWTTPTSTQPSRLGTSRAS